MLIKNLSWENYWTHKQRLYILSRVPTNMELKIEYARVRQSGYTANSLVSVLKEYDSDRDNTLTYSLNQTVPEF